MLPRLQQCQIGVCVLTVVAEIVGSISSRFESSGVQSSPVVFLLPIWGRERGLTIQLEN